MIGGARSPSTGGSTGAPVDVVEVATAIIMQGNWRATMVSTNEVTALAAAVVNFTEALSVTALLLHQIKRLGDEGENAQLKAGADQTLEQLSQLLNAIGFLSKESADANS